MSDIESRFEDLVGKTVVSIDGAKKGSAQIVFVCADGKRYEMSHDQDCCEIVEVEDVCGDVEDLLNSPIIKASEDSNSENPPGVSIEYQDSFTWTFYNISTIKGHVTLRWYGESNGYYGESVDFREIGGKP